MLQGIGDTGIHARTLRQQMAPAEIGLWLALKQRPAGFKFRKQHPSGPYVADFYCHVARLVVEVDGTAHEFGDRPNRDAARDRWFAARGLATMRVPASEVMRDCDAVVRGIVALAAKRLAEQE